MKEYTSTTSFPPGYDRLPIPRAAVKIFPDGNRIQADILNVFLGPVQGYLLLLLLLALLRRIGILPEDVQDALLKLPDPAVALQRLREWIQAVSPQHLATHDRLRDSLSDGSACLEIPA